MWMLLYVLVFGVWLAANIAKYGINGSTLLLFLYFISMCSGIVLLVCYPETIIYPYLITPFSVSFHIILLILILSPLIRFGNRIEVDKIKIEEKTINKYAIAIVIPSFISIAISLVTIKILFELGNFHSARQLFLDGSLEGSYVEKLGYLGYIVSLGKCCSSIALLLGMYYYFVLEKRNIMAILLLISSFCYPLYTLSFAGRDGIVRWAIIFILGLILFKKYIFVQQNKKIIVGLCIFGLIGTAIFLKITIDRFDIATSYGPLYSVFRYLGEPYYTFSYGFDRFGEHPMYDTILSPFPLITQEKQVLTDLNAQFAANYYLNTFHTLVGSLLNNVGTIKVLILLLIINISMFMILGKYNKCPKITLTKFVIFTLYYEIMISGLFYNMYKDRFVQFGILFYILFAFYLTHTSYFLPRIYKHT